MKLQTVIRKIPSVLVCCLILAGIAAGCSLATVEPGISSSRHALVYGIADYTVMNDLTYTVRDAWEMNALLSDRGYSTLYRNNEDVTKEQILLDIETLRNRPNPDDNDIILFYFSGHGDGYLRESPLDDTLEPSLIPSAEYRDQSSIIPDIGSSDPDEVLYADELLQTLSEVPGKKVVIIDICFAGGFVYESATDIDGLPTDYGYTGDNPLLLETWKQYFSAVADNPYADIWVIGSAGVNELAWEGSGIENGYFSYNLLSGLGYNHQYDTISDSIPADRNGDSLVTVTEVYMEAFKRFNDSYNRNSTVPSANKYYAHLSGGAYDLILFGD